MSAALTHHELDWLLEKYQAGAMLFGSPEHDAFVEAAVEYVPRLVEAVRSVLPGELLLDLRIPGFVPSGTLNSREHWSARKRRVAKEHQIVCAALASWHSKNGRALKPFPWVVTITRCSARLLDDDNAVGAAKGARDSIAKWYCVNDRDPRITWRVEQSKCKRAEQGTIIRIEAASSVAAGSGKAST